MVAEMLAGKWEWKPLCSVVAAKELWNPAKQPRASFRYVDIASIDNAVGRISEAREISGEEAPSRARKVIRSGDVIFATTRPYLRNIAVVPTELDDQICSTGFCVLRPKPEAVLTSWLFCVVRSDLVLDQVIPNQEKSAYPAVSDDEVLKAQVPVPTLNEQQRIVARIGCLTERLSAVQSVHAQARQSLARLFDVALHRHLGEDAIEDWPAYLCGDLLTPVSGQVDPKEEPYASMPHLGPENLESGTGQLAVPLSTNREAGIRSGNYLYGPEHVVYSKIRPALRKVFLPDHKGTCSADMYPLLPNRKLISREFLALSLLAPPFSRYAVDNSERNAMPKINRDVLLAFRMRVPDKKIQRQIVAEILGLQRKARRLAKFQDKIKAELASFTPALLAKAFRGEL